MTLNLHAPDTEEQLQPRITVVGVGGAGGNAVNNMISSNLEGVDFLVCNTDAQALTQSLCQNRLQLGRGLTRGLGGGSRPDVGRAAAEEAIEDIAEHTSDSDMLFIAAGMGGATGTGAAPVIARAAREKGILTVAVVTKPFTFEGVHRMRVADQGITELEKEVDTLIIIPNQNLFRVANEKTTFADAFKMADEVLYSGVRGVTDLVVKPGLINLDFADIRSVMTEMGKAMMGTGEASGENRAIASAEAAISNPLLDDVSMQGARGVLINITGGPDLTLFEVDEAANRIRDEVDESANIIFGSTYDSSLDGTMRISVVATGIEAEEKRQGRPVTLSVVGDDGARRQPEAPAAEPEATPASAARTSAEPATAAATASAEPAPTAAVHGGNGQPSPVRAQGQTAEALADEEEPLVLDREEAFIAPEPVQAPRRPSVAADAADRRPDPFQAAAVSNASRKDRTEEPRNGGRSFWSRMAEAARGGPSGERDKHRDPAPRRSEEPQLSAGRAEPRPAPRVEPQPETRSAAQPQQQSQPQQTRQRQNPGQPRLSGLEPGNRSEDRAMEEDQLDIPAFLRRQAN